MQRPTVVELFERHHGAVYRYFRRLTGRREPAEDLTQELFVRVLQALPAYEPREREIAWLFRIARNLWIDQWRSAGTRDPFGRDRPMADEVASPPTQFFAVSLDEALAQVGDLDRDVFLLRELGGLSYTEIADVCELTPDAVRSRICRARSALREHLASDVSVTRPSVKKAAP